MLLLYIIVIIIESKALLIHLPRTTPNGGAELASPIRIWIVIWIRKREKEEKLLSSPRNKSQRRRREDNPRGPSKEWNSSLRRNIIFFQMESSIHNHKNNNEYLISIFMVFLPANYSGI